MRAVLRTKHYSIRTEDAYLQWAKRYIFFHGKRHPSFLGAPEINEYLSHLAVERNVSSSTQTQALCAILFLYRDVLGDDVPWLENLVRAPRTRRLPTVLTREEVRLLIARMSGTPQMIARLLYGTGARLLEMLRLRVKDIDFQTRELTVRNGKGDHDAPRCCLSPACARCASTSPACASCMTRTLRRDSAACGCRTRWLSNTQAPRERGSGNGCFRPRG
jgi:integrase